MDDDQTITFQKKEIDKLMDENRLLKCAMLRQEKKYNASVDRLKRQNLLRTRLLGDRKCKNCTKVLWKQRSQGSEEKQQSKIKKQASTRTIKPE